MSDEASLIEKSLPVKENHEFPILKTLPFTDHESSNIFCAVIESNQVFASLFTIIIQRANFWSHSVLLCNLKFLAFYFHIFPFRS